jgi:broad specificity phosphatase PhoE
MAGRGCDFPLSDKGVVQAHKAAEFLKKKDITRVISSPMLRAVQTAEIVVGAIGGRCIEQCRDLFPWALGPQFDGEKKEEQEEKLKYLIDNPNTTPLHGESLNDFKDTVGDMLECVFNCYDPPLLVTHSNVICVTKDLISGTTDSKPGLEDGISPAGVIAIYEEGDDEYSCQVLLGSE